jgi:hypothetical protein
MKIKIEKNSRYYEPLFKLLSIFSADHFFNEFYNSDKQWTYTHYDSPKNVINVIIDGNRIIEKAKDFFEMNLFREEEIKLLIENIVPRIQKFGSSAIEQYSQSDDGFRAHIEEIKIARINSDITEELIINKIEYFSVKNQDLINVLLNLRAYLLKEIESLYSNNNKNLPPQQNETKKEQESPITLSSIITHSKSNEIVESIKVQYKNIKGKRLKLLLIAFQHLELLPKERISKNFHDCCKNEFEWNISSYNAMNGYDFNKETDNIEVENMKQYLEKMIKSN